jgi:flagellar hook-basal body complex protein FliE
MIQPIRNITLPDTASSPSLNEVAGPSGKFQEALEDAIFRVEGQRQQAQASVGRFLNGEGEELHQVALATQRADLSFEMFLQVRNKVVNAYQEIMRLQM